MEPRNTPPATRSTGPAARITPNSSPPPTGATRSYGRRQATLAAFSRRVLAVSNVDELLEASTQAVAQALQAEFVAALEYDRAADTLSLRAGSGWREECVGRTTLHAGTEFQEGYTLDRPDPILVADHNAEIRFAASPLLVEHGIQSSVCATIRRAQSPFGLLGAYASRPRVFTQDDSQFMQVIAHVAGAALARLEAESAVLSRPTGPPKRAASTRSEVPAASKRVEVRADMVPGPPAGRSPSLASQDRKAVAAEAATIAATIADDLLRESARRLRALGHIAALATASETLADTLQPIVEEIARATGYPMTAIELWDAERETLALGAATVAPGAEPIRPVDRPLHETLAAPVVQSGEPRVERADETSPERREALRRIGATTFVCFPLRVREQVVGTLSLAHREDTACDDEFKLWLTGVCHCVALVVSSKRNERALREERDFAVRAMSVLGQGVTVVDVDGKFEYVNPAFATLVGRSAEDLVGVEFDELIPPECLPELQRHWARRMAGETTTYDTQLRGPEGRLLDALITGAPKLQGDKIAGSISAITDITALKRAEDARRVSEERFRMVFELGMLGIVVTNLDGQFLEANQAFCAMLGYDADELSKLTWTDITHPDDVERSMRLVEDWKRDHRRQLSLEKRYLTKKNETIHGRTFISTTRDADGKPLYFVAMIEDVTEQHRAQERLNTLETERRRHERESRLQIVRAQDEERARLARDLHDGLGQVLMALQLSLKSKAQDRDDLAPDLRSIGLAISLVRQMSHQLHPAELEVGRVSTVAQQSLSTIAASPRIRVDIEGQEPPLSLEQKTHLYRITQEAVTNAVKHGRPSNVRVLFRWSPDALELTVTDDGRGMDTGTDGGVGLRNLRDRALLLHGTTAWKHRHDGGTEFRLSIAKLSRPAAVAEPD